MATLTLEVPEDVLDKLHAQVEEDGNGPLEQYLSRVLHGMVMEPVYEGDDELLESGGETGGPLSPEMEGMLLAGLASPAEEVDDAYRARLRKEIEEQVAVATAGEFER